MERGKVRIDIATRVARADDAADLLSAMVAFNELEGIAFDPVTIAPALAKLLAEPELGFVLVARTPEDGRLAGYAIVTFNYDLEFAGRDAILTELFVVANRRRAGVGRALLDAAETHAVAETAGALHLAVRPENAAARALYEAAGFAVVPRIWMTKRLVRDGVREPPLP